LNDFHIHRQFVKKINKNVTNLKDIQENEIKIKNAIIRLFLKNIIASLIENLNADNNVYLTQFLDIDDKNTKNFKEIFKIFE